MNVNLKMYRYFFIFVYIDNINEKRLLFLEKIILYNFILLISVFIFKIINIFYILGIYIIKF